MSFTHPSDLAAGRKRCAPAREKIDGLDRECVTACNICGSPKNVILSERDRYGLPLRTAMCAACGLVYLVDRLSASGYSRFYHDGLYREVSSAYLGVQHRIAEIQTNQADYAGRLAATLTGYLDSGAGGSLIDIGGSAGIVALEFKRRFGMRAVVLDPSAEEAGAARKAGLEAVTGTLEDWSTDERFDVILLCRSVEHFFDLKTALDRIRQLLAPGGVFYCDIADFMELCRLSGAPETVTKIDHCYWLSHDTAPAIFRASGLEVLSTNLVSGPGQVGFLLRPCDPAPIVAHSPEWVENRVLRLLEIEAAWREYGASYRDFADWLHRKAYRLKRKAMHSMRLAKPGAVPGIRTVSAGNQ